MPIKVNHEDLPTQSFEDAYRGRVCVRVFIRVSVRLLRLSELYCVIIKNILYGVLIKVNLEDLLAQYSKILIGVGFTYVYS